VAEKFFRITAAVKAILTKKDKAQQIESEQLFTIQ